MRQGNRARLLGAFGEDAACRYLQKKGYKLLARNFTCRMGEVDIIAQKGRFVVFAEVKLRKNADFGQAREFVTAAKQRRIITAAEMWLMQNKTELQPRFDVIEVYAPEGQETKKTEIHHLEDAYQL